MLLHLGDFWGVCFVIKKAGKFIVFALQSKQAVMAIDKQTHIGASGCNVINHHQVSNGKGMLAQIAFLLNHMVQQIHANRKVEIQSRF